MIRKYKINRDILMSLFILACGAMMAVGRFYDERLELFGVNFSIIFSSIFISLFFSILFLIKTIRIDLNKILFYAFYCILIISNLILWILFDATDYGIDKFLNFLLIPFLISLIIIEKFRIRDRDFMIKVLLCISVLLFVVTLLNLSTLSSTRTGVLGGGPIVLSRWLCFGAVVVLFHPKIKRFNFIYMLLFLFAALFTGSRGPILSFCLVIILYFFLNFKRVFFRILALSSLFVFLLFVTGAIEKLSRYQTVSRIFINIEEGGLRKSNARSLLFEASFQEIKKHPLGLGSGNFIEYTDKSDFFKNKQLYYSHNLFFEIATEFGIISFFFFLIYLLHSIYLSFKLNQKNKLQAGNMMFYIFVFLFLNSLISGDLNDSRLLFIFLPLMLVKEIE